MGQQQLLLIVLGVIVVGIAVVLGIQYFSVGAEEAAKDELVAHCLTIGANAQQWFKKPVSMGGGGGSFDGTYNTVNGSWDIPEKLQASQSAGILNADGSLNTAGYVASGQSTTQVTITATPNNPDYLWTVVCTVYPENMNTVVTPNP